MKGESQSLAKPGQQWPVDFGPMTRGDERRRGKGRSLELFEDDLQEGWMRGEDREGFGKLSGSTPGPLRLPEGLGPEIGAD